MLSRMTAEFTSVSHGPSARVPKNAALATCRLAKAQSDTPAAEKKIEFCHHRHPGRDPWPPRPLRRHRQQAASTDLRPAADAAVSLENDAPHPTKRLSSYKVSTCTPPATPSPSACPPL